MEALVSRPLHLCLSVCLSLFLSFSFQVLAVLLLVPEYHMTDPLSSLLTLSTLSYCPNPSVSPISTSVLTNPQVQNSEQGLRLDMYFVNHVFLDVAEADVDGQEMESM